MTTYAEANQEVYRIIKQAEIEFGVELTWGAAEMLVIPVIETLPSSDLEWEKTRESIHALVADIAREGPPANDRFRKIRDARSVIGGFYRLYCGIPPFCGRKE